MDEIKETEENKDLSPQESTANKDKIKNSISFYQGTRSLLKEIESDNDEKEIINKSIEEIQNKMVEFFNVKNIHFLFGSGTSCNAIPNMSGLLSETIKVIEEFKDGNPTEQLHKDVYDEFTAVYNRTKKDNLEDILGILYSNKIYLEKYIGEEYKLKVCEKLIILIEETIFDKLNIGFEKDEAKKVLKSYEILYRKIALRNKDLNRINVFTTNNDLFNETALDKLNIHYMNGFGGGLNKFFNPALFNYTYSKRMDTSIEKYEPVENVVNLYKLHGSVNWIEDDSNQNTFFQIREVGYPEKLDRNQKNILIYPTPTKQNKSLGSPYVELFREFQKKILQPHSVLFVVGYSFSDEHVNNVIYQALATNSSINLVILNDISKKDIAHINDKRIFKIWGKDEKGSKIHYFDYFVKNILPDMDQAQSSDELLKSFIQYYNQNKLK